METLARLCSHHPLEKLSLTDHSVMTAPVYTTQFSSPLGDIILAATERGLCGLYFHDQRYLPQARALWQKDEAKFDRICQQLGDYFAGKNFVLDVPLDPITGTPFQHRVWRALQQIPLGQTWTYAQLAAHLGSRKAVRAVGSAVGRNPLSLIIPCHRVIGTNGSLTGYAGGIERKRWLLAHEAAFPSQAFL